jgi:hypothetical protein
MGERTVRIRKVESSILFGSTKTKILPILFGRIFATNTDLKKKRKIKLKAALP